MSQPSAFSFHVTGRVQGVWFRGWTKDMASSLGISGWVTNDADGTVSGVIEGPPEALERMIAHLHHGPDLARVDKVTVGAHPPEGLTEFTILR